LDVLYIPEETVLYSTCTIKSFKQKTVTYGDITLNEDNAEQILIDYPVLDFKKWPEYNDTGEIMEDEDE
jgi:hypothetical protein